MNVEASLPPEEPATTFFVGHHETQRTGSVSDELLAQAEGLGYDFVTTPITTPVFHSRVLKLITTHIEEFQLHKSSTSIPLPLISPLTPKDTVLTPVASNPSRIAIASPWIDLGSAIPIVAHFSRQVFNLEIAYAAFCGINNVIVYGPVEGSDPVQYARAIHAALGLGPYLQLHILMPITGELELEYPDGTHLSELASADTDKGGEETETDSYAAWQTWDTIRTLCSYSNKLSVGETLIPAISLALLLSPS
jgi:protein arginine N-methyltransferase 5